MIALILAGVIAFFSTITRSNEPQKEPITSYALKTAVIAFVVIYFGLGFLQTSCPDIEVGEPDF